MLPRKNAIGVEKPQYCKKTCIFTNDLPYFIGCTTTLAWWRKEAWNWWEHLQQGFWLNLIRKSLPNISESKNAKNSLEWNIFLNKKFASLLCRCWQHKTSVSWKRCLTNMQRFRVTQSRRRSSQSSAEIAGMDLWLSSNVCEIVMPSLQNCFTTQWRWVCYAQRVSWALFDYLNHLNISWKTFKVTFENYFENISENNFTQILLKKIGANFGRSNAKIFTAVRHFGPTISAVYLFINIFNIEIILRAHTFLFLSVKPWKSNFFPNPKPLDVEA